MHFKYKEDRELFATLNPILIMIVGDLATYAYEKHNINLTITQTVSTIEMDKKLKRKSPAHREKRACDIRTSDIKDGNVIRDLTEYLNNKWAYKKYQYMSKAGVKRLAYWHKMKDGAEHLHIAIHSKYKL